MTERIASMLAYYRNNEHHRYRKTAVYAPTARFAAAGVSDERRVTERLREVLRAEEPVVLPGEKIAYLRTVSNLPEIFTSEEWEAITSSHAINEAGRLCNISPDYAHVIGSGLLAQRESCLSAMKGADVQKSGFLSCVVDSIDAVLELADRYREAALRAGNTVVAETLSRVPRYGARTLLEAFQFFRILHYTLWCEGEYHNTVGRLDLYMAPYFEADREAGRLSDDEAFELIEEFFLTFNKDSDLYVGVQKGDNGQSVMLGGVDAAGNPVYSRFSELCIEASRDLKIIDPKINLRVTPETPLEVLEKATELTKVGIGYPQYANDAIVIPGLVRDGYALEDARNYTVAACWEFVIPGLGMDVPNIGTVNFPRLVNEAVLTDLEGAPDYEAFYAAFRRRLYRECAEINTRCRNLYIVPAPFLSLLMLVCIDSGQDITKGGKYNNFGYHGAGISTAVDSLAVIQKCIYTEQSLSKADARAVVEGTCTEELLHRLRYEEPKYGDGDEITTNTAVRLFHDFSGAVRGLRNDRGGGVKAGTGCAMSYISSAREIGNTLSGHRRGEAYGADYSPELFVRSKGPLSAIRSLTAPDFREVINGGPMTMEFHSSVFRDPDGIRKVAMLVREFLRLGGHQLQLNTVNRDTLLDAQQRPDEYRNLIVRIWGWSAYFTEIDKVYQDHIIERQEYRV